jgi:hypothetical protein
MDAHTRSAAKNCKSNKQTKMKKKRQRRRLKMSNRSSNTAAVPEAKSALDRFKFEVANELGVPLSDGYNGNLTSKQNGSVGGYMVKKMIENQERQMTGSGMTSGTGTTM